MSEQSLDDPHVEPVGRRRSSTRRVRSVAAGFVGVIAIIGVMASTFAVWAQAVLFDSDRVAALVDDALAQPEVTAALAREVTDLVFVAADVETRLESLFPPALEPLAPVLSGGSQVFVQERIERRLETEETRQAIAGLVRRSHGAAMRVLEGDGMLDGVRLVDGEVTVNLLPLVGRGLTVVQGFGLLGNVDVPDLMRDGVPEQQIAALEAAFDRDLPDDFGQFVVYRSDALTEASSSLAAAQSAMVLAKRAIWAILAVTAVVLVAAVMLANDRRRAALTLALAGVAAALVLRAVTLYVVGQAPTLAVDPAARALISSTVEGLATGLFRLLAAIVVVGLVVTAVAFVTGPSSVARSVRGSGDRSSVLTVVDTHREAVAITAFGVAVAMILLVGVGIGGLILAALFAALGGVVLLRGR
jgi:hypothetical protein